ncbi:MAG: CoA transferase, partial [Dehalococcoidia bacterium]|nr:CoA transferase [Dehalococcoidia bacterium]
ADSYELWHNQEELDRLITAWTLNHTHYEVMGILQSAGVAAMPSLSNQEINSDPHFKHRGIATVVDHPVMGKQAVFGVPWHYSRTPVKVQKASPLMGENNEHVFGELLGIPASEIKRLEDEQVIY